MARFFGPLLMGALLLVLLPSLVSAQVVVSTECDTCLVPGSDIVYTRRLGDAMHSPPVEAERRAYHQAIEAAVATYQEHPRLNAQRMLGGPWWGYGYGPGFYGWGFRGAFGPWGWSGFGPWSRWGYPYGWNAWGYRAGYGYPWGPFPQSYTPGPFHVGYSVLAPSAISLPLEADDVQ